jgi:uncharacterized protein DUF1203
MSFRIQGLAPEVFADLFSLRGEALAARGAMRVTVDSKPAYPCRISLADAEIGDELILTHHEHHAVDAPFRSSYAIYVREGERRYDEIDRVPQALRSRLISLRAFDRDGMLLDCDVAEGRELGALIERLFTNPRVEYQHAHFARPGCYAALIQRA